MTPFSIEWLREAGARGDIADVTGRLDGEKLELDFPGRRTGRREEGEPAAESKLRLLKTSSLRGLFAAGLILPEDLVLVYGKDGRVIHAGTVTPGLHLQHLDHTGGICAGAVSSRSAAAYLTRWRSAAGIKVLRKPWLPFHYTKKECFVPMRDGVRLYTAVYEPAGAGPKPIILMRSPYPTGTYGYGGVGDLSEKLSGFTRRGYIIVEQNVRGTCMSEGEFEDLRPPGGGCDEATDAYDTIEWLLQNTRSNGRVGIYGVSYPGFYATLAATCAHPALRAVSPQAPVTDWWMGDDAHHNGAFMLSDMYGFGGAFFRPKGNPTPDWKDSLHPVPEDADLYDFFRGKAMADILRPFLGGDDSAGDDKAPLKGFSDIVGHPGYDSFWKERNPLRHLHKVKPAVMVVGGWYDAEDAWGAVNTYRALKKQSPGTESFFVCGPWTHGGWRKDSDFLERIEAPFFEYFLEGKGERPHWRELLIPTGAGQGENLSSRKTSFAIPSGSYISDPSNPVPFMETVGTWRNKAYMWADQCFASAREDVLSGIAAGPLDQAVTATGPVEVRLRFSVEEIPEKTDGKGGLLDADLVVKLIDLAPDGSQTLVRGDICPARWRGESFGSRAEALSPGTPTELRFSMTDICHRFEKGHSLMVQVQSSWFPLAAMNPQRFLDNPYKAEAEDYIPIKVTILPGSELILLIQS